MARLAIAVAIGITVMAAAVAGHSGTASFGGKDGRIVFESTSGGGLFLFTANAGGTALHRLTQAGDQLFGPRWSPDGRWVAYTRIGGDLLVRSADGRVVRPRGARGRRGRPSP